MSEKVSDLRATQTKAEVEKINQRRSESLVATVLKTCMIKFEKVPARTGNAKQLYLRQSRKQLEKMILELPMNWDTRSITEAENWYGLALALRDKPKNTEDRSE